jgi:hypothetical protein
MRVKTEHFNWSYLGQIQANQKGRILKKPTAIVSPTPQKWLF